MHNQSLVLINVEIIGQYLFATYEGWDMVMTRKTYAVYAKNYVVGTVWDVTLARQEITAR